MEEHRTVSVSKTYVPNEYAVYLSADDHARFRDCDSVVGDANVSRHHAEIRPAGEGWTIADLGSTNGVLVNGQRARGAVPLAAGDQVELGTSTLRFELE